MSTLEKLHNNFVDIVAAHQEKENAALQIGGEDLDCEADEVAFRARACPVLRRPSSKAKAKAAVKAAAKSKFKAKCSGKRMAKAKAASSSEPKCRQEGVDDSEKPAEDKQHVDIAIEWLRYIAFARRGSSQILLEKLPSRIVQGAGQGGGGALSIEELSNVMRLSSDKPLLLPGSVLHTDSAKAYRRVGPLQWPANGALHDPDFYGAYADFRYVHTNVTHKKKVGQKTNYVLKKTIKTAAGTTREVKGGTQQIDGYWTTLRTAVSRTGVNTGEHGTPVCERLHKLVRVHQWHYWWANRDRFALFCDLAKENNKGEEDDLPLSQSVVLEQYSYFA